MSDQLFCDEPECERPVAGHGRGKCSAHLKQLQRTGKCTPIAEKLSLEERAIVAGTAMLEAESDEDFKRCRRAYLLACAALGTKHAPDVSVDELRKQIDADRARAIRRGLEVARSRGVHVGRPPKVSAEEIRRLFELLRSVDDVARVLNMSRSTVYYRLGNDRKPTLFGQDHSATSGPRSGGESL